jgi:hypothetical protein
MHIPDWLYWWDWYSGLSTLAVQYYWIEKFAMLTRLIPSLPVTPAVLLASLIVQFPELRQAANQFKTGLYKELYSQDKDYNLVDCKAAGAALQKGIVSGFWNRVFHLTVN